jgi:hypothetical protein
MPDLLALALLIAIALAIGLRARPKKIHVDPRAAVVHQYEARLLQFIRDRYQCPEPMVKRLWAAYLDWEYTAEMRRLTLAADGTPVIDDETARLLDRCPADIGLRPSTSRGSGVDSPPKAAPAPPTDRSAI